MIPAPTPLVADEYDHTTQDQPCTWCGDDIGLCAYIRGVGGDMFHVEPCWPEVTQSVPAEATT